jgi:hypothetical protein
VKKKSTNVQCAGAVRRAEMIAKGGSYHHVSATKLDKDYEGTRTPYDIYCNTLKVAGTTQTVAQYIEAQGRKPVYNEWRTTPFKIETFEVATRMETSEECGTVEYKYHRFKPACAKGCILPARSGKSY